MQKIFSIQGRIQPYQWGGNAYLSQLLGIENTQRLPQAEYWLGAHPAAPATLSSDDKTLIELLETKQWALRFLLKVLDVRDMLSIQVHPSRVQAIEGYQKEQHAGIPINAAHRNYKDDNHKPELMVALSEFWLLHGFRDPHQINNLLAPKPFLHPLLNLLKSEGMQTAFATLLDNNHPLTLETHQRLKAHFSQGNAPQDKTDPDFWVARWLRHNPDVVNGILSLYFLNLISLTPGEAIYQPAGLLHAYLEGQNVELMANSDNVLRAGLTPKHMDIAELLNIGLILPTNPNEYIVHPIRSEQGEIVYTTPFEEFELSELRGENQFGFNWQSPAGEILLCTDGTAQLTQNAHEAITLRQGEALYIAPGTPVNLAFKQTSGRIFRAKNLP